MSARRLSVLTFSAVIASATLMMGCASGPLTTREKAAGIGALGGAAAGAAVGSAVDHPGTGALIGGAIGLGAGALIGDQLEAREQAQQPPRVVERPPPRETIIIERERDDDDVVVIERDRQGPPPWAPAHGWRRKHERYYYYPAVQVYYYPSVRRYYWLEGREWRFGPRLPRYIVIEQHRKIDLDLDYEPHTRHAKIKSKYPPNYYAKGKGKRKEW